jgi:3-hydroxypropanoate dehydrogenase
MNQPLGDAALDQLFRTARTYNGYLDTPVSEDQLRAIWDLMKMGPTSANTLPARLVWCVSAEAKEQLADAASSTNADKIRKAPVAVIIGMDHEFYENLPDLFPHVDARSWFIGNDALIESTAFRNSSLQGAYFILAARALGRSTSFPRSAMAMRRRFSNAVRVLRSNGSIASPDIVFAACVASSSIPPHRI